MRTFCLLLLMVFAVTPALAEPASGTVDFSYSLSFWGIDFGHVQYTAALKSQTYAARAHFETDGAVGFLWKSLIDATAEGALDAHGASPALYDSYSHYRDRPAQRVKITYPNGEPSALFDPVVDLSRFPVSKEQAKDAADPMSALISVLTGAGVTVKAPCGADVQVFDGRRRYAVTFAYVKDEQLDLGHGRQAKARLCELHFVLIAGYPQRLIMEGREPPKMYADFAAMPKADAPGGRYRVPVKVWAELGWGTVTATLDMIRLDNAVPALWAAKG
jgi:Protein of unknown function (DUF3108)